MDKLTCSHPEILGAVQSVLRFATESTRTVSEEFKKSKLPVCGFFLCEEL